MSTPQNGAAKPKKKAKPFRFPATDGVVVDVAASSK
jgi:hypothetical protein